MGVDRPPAIDAAEIAAVRAALRVAQLLAPIMLRRVIGGSIGDAYFLRAYRFRRSDMPMLGEPELQQAASAGPRLSESCRR